MSISENEVMIMKKKICYVIGIILISGMCTAGCGVKETGSELLTQAEEAVVPVEQTVEPAARETPEGIALHIYSGDEQAENIVQRTVYVEEVNENVVAEQLAAALGMDAGMSVKSLTFGMHGGDRVAVLDLDKAFSDYVNRLGVAGEYIVMGSLTNTFLDCYQCGLLLVKTEGRVLETGHTVYEEYLEMYPYVESAYQIREELLEEEGLSIACPQIAGLGDEHIQEKWNRIMLDNEKQAMESWKGGGTYIVTYTVKTMTADVLSILCDRIMESGEGVSPDRSTFKYTYNIDLNTGESIRLKNYVDVEKTAENILAGTGYYVDETLARDFAERIHSIYADPGELARALEGYDYSEEGGAPYGYSYLEAGRVWLCMEIPHESGDYMEIELDIQQTDM